MWTLGQLNTRRNRRGKRSLACQVPACQALACQVPAWRVVAAAVLLLIGSSTTVKTILGSVAMAAQPESQSPPALAFVETQLGESREGYFTLEWSAVGGAALYRVRNDADQIAYQGVATQSFQSGLSDGVYRYRVEAIGDDGEVLATSAPAVATVRHWGLFPSLVLFAIGAIVVGGIGFIILRGRWIEKQVASGGDERVLMLQAEVETGGKS